MPYGARHDPSRCGPRGRGAACPRARQGGFSFIELVVVMGAMGVLLGLAVGYIGNIGRATFIMQAKSMLAETAYRCQNASIGDRRAILTLREAEDEEGARVLRLGAAVARPVLTHQFETLEFASGARTPQVHGNVELKRGEGRVGNGVHFALSSHLSFSAQSLFAMTEGLELDVWIRPEAAARQMTLVRGDESYEVYLLQSGESDAYDVYLKLKLRKIAEEGELAADLHRTFRTTGAPVIADGRWSRVQVGFDGLEASLRVNGLEAYEPETKRRGPAGAIAGSELSDLQRIAVPRTGVVAVTISAPSTAYVGLMDSFRLMGVFRSEDLERDLPGELEVIYPAIPLRIVYRNGALDPDVHSGDQVIRLKDLGNPEDPPLRLTMGMYGTIQSVFEKPGEGGPTALSERERAAAREDGR